MKSGLAVMAFVLGELAESGCVPQKTIVFAGTCDEERGGLGAKEIIKEYPDLFPELLLIGEPTSCQAGNQCPGAGLRPACGFERGA